MTPAALLEVAAARPIPEDVDTPCLLVDVAIMDRNLDEMAGLARAAGKRLLPHGKTHRMGPIGRRQVERGADGLCVATLGEAEEFARHGVTEVVLAYPLVGPGKVRRAVELATTVDLTLAVDGVEAAREISTQFAAAGRRAAVRLLIDSGLGRVGVTSAEAGPVASEIARLPGLDLTGVLTHEGTVYEAADRSDLAARCRAVAAEMVAIAEDLRSRGIDVRDVSVGASASARLMAEAPGITELRPGIYTFNDLGQVALGNARLEDCAATVAATIVSNPRPGVACLDAGSKSLGLDLVPASAHRADLPGHGLVLELPGWQLARLSEEHGWLRWTGDGSAPALTIGARVQIVPNHACIPFASLAVCALVEDGRVTDIVEGFTRGRPR